MCEALYTQYFPESCEKNHRHFTRVGFEPVTFAIWESTEYTVLHTSVYMGKNKKLIFFIPDANLTSSKQNCLRTFVDLTPQKNVYSRYILQCK